MSLKSALIMAAVMALAAPAAVRAEGTSEKSGPADSGGAGTTGGAQEAAQGVVDAETTKILADLHRTNTMEIEMAKLAQDKAQSQSVKQYGENVLKDHESAQKKVSDLADQLGIALPDKEQTLANKEKSAMNHLKSLEGAEFDKAFTQHMAEDHEKAVSKLEASQKKLSGPAAQLVTELLPVLRDHQATAKKLAKNPNAPVKSTQQ